MLARIRGQMVIGVARVLAGAPGVEWIRTAVDELTIHPDLPEDPRRPHWQVIGTLFLREAGSGRDLMSRAINDDRTRTALGALPTLLFHTARDDATTDRWASGMAAYDESIVPGKRNRPDHRPGYVTGRAGLVAGQDGPRRGMSGQRRRSAHACRTITASPWPSCGHSSRWAICISPREMRRAAADWFQRLQTTLHHIAFLDVDLAPGPELAEAQLRNGDVSGCGRDRS